MDHMKNVSSLAPCNHEEADTCLLLHAVDAAWQGHDKSMLHIVDTDVLVLAVSFFSEVAATELWVAFGTGNNLRYIPAHIVALHLGEERSRALLMFQSFAGCDTNSAFHGKGNCTDWETWSNYQEVTSAFLSCEIHRGVLIMR